MADIDKENGPGPVPQEVGPRPSSPVPSTSPPTDAAARTMSMELSQPVVSGNTDPWSSNPNSNNNTSNPNSNPNQNINTDGPEGGDANPADAADRPLNVTDALSYLDAVKHRFHNRPDVYNQFLDIMKDFKSQVIDTPGVIRRVSILFRGHPALIQGFNTFLPMGYRIEWTATEDDPNLITVTTPTGTTTQSTTNFPHSHEPTPTPAPPVPQQEAGGLPPPPQPSASMLLGPPADIIETKATTSRRVSPQPPPRAPEPDRTQLELALQYLNKIRSRFSDTHPETYQSFLGILHRAQSNGAAELGPSASSSSQSLDEVRAELWSSVMTLFTEPQGGQAEVLMRVEALFRHEPDLLRDFQSFMAQKGLESGSLMGEGARAGSGSSRKRNDPPASSAAASQPTSKRKRKLPEKEKEKEREKEAVTGGRGGASKRKQASGPIDGPSTSYAPYQSTPPSPHRVPYHQRAAPLPQVPPAQDAATFQTSTNESTFFARVKRALDSRDSYNEFLKLINLFTQDIIDSARLIRESRTYLGDGELMDTFKEIVGWDDRKERERLLAEEQEQAWASRPMGLLEAPRRIDQGFKYGSYRRLPADEMNTPCSGRDEMCKSVLNDEWVSHPTFASEDSGFFTHKKNIYEEALHRSEEERHEYDFHIEAIGRTIGSLEPINNKIASLGPEERSNYKLRPNLGGMGKSVHHRIIKKIHGREAGLEVIQAMQESPALAIPVVLSRLKQKEAEWKRAQREWNKVWRELDARNYHKSLDHQGITFKANDKKTITTKTFVSQIEAARDEQMAKRAALVDPLFARARPRHQLEYAIDDIGVLQDTLKLAFSFLDRTSHQIGFAERKRIEGFIRVFIPLFFMFDATVFNAAFVARHDLPDSEASDEVGSTADDVEVASVGSGSRPGRNGRKGGSSAGDLRKKLLKSEQVKSTTRRTRAQEIVSPSASRPASPGLPEPMQVDGEGSQSSSSAAPGASSSGNPTVANARRGVCFTNTFFYVTLRLVELIYSRLSFFKNLAAKIASESWDPEVPSSADYSRYGILLDFCERLFDSEIEQNAFEDQMRNIFGSKDAFRIFTIDKVIGALIKQIQQILADNNSLQLYELLKRERALDKPTTQDYINMRRNAERVVGPDENLFRLEWLPDLKVLTIQLLGKDDSGPDDPEVLTGRWQAYVDSFISSAPSLGAPLAKVKSPFLRRNLPSSDDKSRVSTRDGLEIKICVRTYRFFYVSNTEDFFYRIPPREERQTYLKNLEARNVLRKKALERF